MNQQFIVITIMTIPILMVIVLGLIFVGGKGSSFIAGFNTMPSEKKKEYDVTALCKFVGKIMFALAFSMLFWILSIVFKMTWLFLVGLILFIGIIAFSIVYMNTGNRFKNTSN